MSKEEPAWKAELLKTLDGVVESWFVSSDDEILGLIQPHILAAEQRGRAAGRREALEKFLCGACGHRVGWIECPTGGWWAHEVHPSDDHDAVECVPESDSQ